MKLESSNMLKNSSILESLSKSFDSLLNESSFDSLLNESSFDSLLNESSFSSLLKRSKGNK